jgi:putative peptide zinc metalloprotease protein
MTRTSNRLTNIRSRVSSRSARLLVVASLIALPGGAGAAVAAAASGDSLAVAVNTKDGSSVFKLTFAINKVAGSSVTNQNAAIAYSSCTACQTVAISIQILLISGSPTTFTPTNVAIAINQNCNLCDTLAAAYQFAVGVDTKLKFTAEGRRQIADIRHQLEMLRNSGLTGPQINAKLNTLMTQLGTVLQTQLVGTNEPASGDASGGNSGSTAPTDTTSTPTNTTSTPTDTTSTSTDTSTTTTPTSGPTNTTSTPTSAPPATAATP